jgi:hypothetical protein
MDFVKKIGDRKRMNPYGSVVTEMPTTVEATDPWALYIYAIKAPATKAKYSQRLKAFLEPRITTTDQAVVIEIQT